jgi:hypothetical protein
MAKQTLYSVTAYLTREHYERIQKARARTDPPLSQSRVVRDYIIGGFAAEDALQAGGATYLKGSEGYPFKPHKAPANVGPPPRRRG